MNASAARLPSFTASALANQTQVVSNEVLKSGAVVVTRHREPTMVLMRYDRYLELTAAKDNKLAALTEQFEREFAAMQTPEWQAGIDRFFEMTPEELGRAAMLAATRSA